jgi:plasmid stabilization system protein ParE
MPLIGIEHAEFGLHSFPVRSYRIYYEIQERRVEIIRVLHQRRNAQRILQRWQKRRR